jgi:hypothetical protein
VVEGHAIGGYSIKLTAANDKKKKKVEEYTEAEKARQNFYSDNNYPRLVTRLQQRIENLVELSKFDEIAEIKKRRPDIADYIDRIIADLWDNHEQRMKQWK